MQIEIVVVDYEQALWFEFEDLKFDTLDAFEEFYGKKVLVIRKGVTIVTGRVWDARGEMVFSDYSGGEGVNLRGSALHAEDFHLSDRLVLDLPDGFSLTRRLAESCRFIDAMIASMPEGQAMTLDEATDKIADELSKATSVTSRILRFRRGK